VGERRELNPRIMESQPTALTIWLRSPFFCWERYNFNYLSIRMSSNYSFLISIEFLFLLAFLKRKYVKTKKHNFFSIKWKTI